MYRTILVAVISGIASPLSVQDQTIEGVWEGTAEVRPDSGLPVTVRLTIERPGNSLLVKFALPESRLINLALPSPYSDSSRATYANGHLRAEFTPDIGLSIIGGLVPRDQERMIFEGDLTGGVLRGTIRITSYSSPITLRRVSGEKKAGEEDVYFLSALDSMRLGGRLVLPSGNGPFAAAIFVPSSDPEVRETWYTEAKALAARGIATLLYDKRGAGESNGASHDLASWDDLAGDVQGAMNYLMTRRDVIDATRVGLIGQSQGTWIIAKVAAADPRVAFLVSISGSGISAAEQETYRTGALMKANGFSDAEIARAQAFQRQKFAVARTGLGWEALDSTMQRLRADSTKWFPGYGTGAAARSLALLRLYGVLQFNYDPTRDLRKIKVPVLVIMGELDRVFPPQVVVDRMRESLRAGGNSSFTSRILAGHGHGLSSVQTSGGRPFRRAASYVFLETLTEWVARTVRK